MKLITIVGTRPQFVKACSLSKSIIALNRGNNKTIIDEITIHTGQHYDKNVSKIFFDDLEIKYPNYHLDIELDRSSRGTEKTRKTEGRIKRMTKQIKNILSKEKPDMVLVYGDSDSTLAGAQAAKKQNIKLAHVEAGLRSFDMDMPEETNRILTDHLSDYLFTSCKDANKNLEEEKIPKERIFFVGNIMIDTLKNLKPKIKNSKILNSLNLKRYNYAVLTLHRPSNVDNNSKLKEILKTIEHISKQIPIIFPVHPRTRKQLNKIQDSRISSLTLIEPLGYKNFLRLCLNAKFIITDSGGIQEETTYLKVPCITLRNNTERPITINLGTNELADLKDLPKKVIRIQNKKWKKGKIPKLWDGKTSERIITTLTCKI